MRAALSSAPLASRRPSDENATAPIAAGWPMSSCSGAELSLAVANRRSAPVEAPTAKFLPSGDIARTADQLLGTRYSRRSSPLAASQTRTRETPEPSSAYPCWLVTSLRPFEKGRTSRIVSTVCSTPATAASASAWAAPMIESRSPVRASKTSTVDQSVTKARSPEEDNLASLTLSWVDSKRRRLSPVARCHSVAAVSLPPPVSSQRASAENDRLSANRSRPRYSVVTAPVARSHERGVPSRPVVTTAEPSGEKPAS